MENNMKLVHALSDNLDRLKVFSTGYTTGNKSALLVSFEGNVYKIDIQKVQEGEVDIDIVDTYL